LAYFQKASLAISISFPFFFNKKPIIVLIEILFIAKS